MLYGDTLRTGLVWVGFVGLVKFGWSVGLGWVGWVRLGWLVGWVGLVG
jgi:hypothetical protein